MARHTSSLRRQVAHDRAGACVAAVMCDSGESALSNLGGAASASVGVLELHVPEVGTIKFRHPL